ncbi:MAG: hypothetical protein AAGA80_24200 [Cyanobacteria bacterium P01_F01_bin.143]
MKLIKQITIAVTSYLIATTPVQAFTVTIEDAKIQSKPITDELFVVDFNDITIDSTDSFSRVDGINSSTYNYGGDLKIRETNVYGGADNSYYIEPAYNTPTAFNIKTDQKQKYFGFWWSAGDGSNVITFLNNGEVVKTFNTQDVTDTLSGLSNGTDYYCNPTPLFSDEICTEPYAFINFFFEGTEAYDQIIIESTADVSNFESDNHTFSMTQQTITGEIVVSNPPAVVFAD